MLLDKIRKNLNDGIKQVKWFASFLSERTKVETSLAKLLFESSKLENRLDSLYSEMGRRVAELEEKGEKAVLKDFIILQTMDEIKKLKKEIDEYKNKAQTIEKTSQ